MSSQQPKNDDLKILCLMLFHPLICIPILETISLILSISDIAIGAYYLQHHTDLPDTCHIIPIPQLLVALGVISLVSGLIMCRPDIFDKNIKTVCVSKLAVIILSFVICGYFSKNKTNLSSCPDSLIKYTLAVCIYRILYYMKFGMALLIIKISDMFNDTEPSPPKLEQVSVV